MGTSTKVAKGKQKAGKKAGIKSNYNLSYDNTINYSFIALISIFLIVAPFYRGLYFRENYIPSIIYISGVFVLYALYKLISKDFRLISSYMDIAMLSLPIVYLISFFFSVNSMDAMDSVLKYASYYMIYKVTVSLYKETAYSKALGYTILTAMFIMAIATLMTAFGYLDLKGVVIGNRIYGLYQYSNATAAAMGAAIFLALGFSLNSKRIYERLYCSLVLAVVFPTFIMTLSRGAYIICAVLIIVFLLIIEARKRVQFIYNLIALIVTDSMFLIKYYGRDNIGDSIIYYIFGVIVFIALQLVYDSLISHKINKLSVKATNYAIFSIFIVSVISASILLSFRVPIEYSIEHANGEVKSWKSIVLPVNEIKANSEYTIKFNVSAYEESENGYRIIVQNLNDDGKASDILDKSGMAKKVYEQKSYKFITNANSTGLVIRLYNYDENSYTIYKDIKILDSNGNIVKSFDRLRFLPEGLSNRLANISLRDRSVSARAYYLRDGLKIAKDFFLFGTGGGGWKSMYRKYQSLPYNSTEAHNFYLQHIIETGIVGFIVLFAVYYLLIRKTYILFFKNKEYEQLPIYIAMLMMMGHAVLDFDLSLPALAYLFWMMVGIASASNKHQEDDISGRPFADIIILIAAIFIIVFSSSMYIGITQGKKASTLIESDIEGSIRLYESAIKKDPLNMNYHMDYMQIMYSQYQSKKDPIYMNKMRKSLEKVLDSGLTDLKYGSVIVNMLLKVGELEKAIDATNTLVNYNPMVSDIYIFKIDVNYQIAKYYFENRQKKAALPYLYNMVEAGTQFDDINKVSLEQLKEPKRLRSMVGLAKNWIMQAENSKDN